MNLQYFSDQDFYFSIKKFFKDLNIPVHYMTEQPALAKDIISNTFRPQNPTHQMIDDVYFLGMVDDRAFNNQPSAIESDRLKEKDYDGLLIFGITLDREGGGVVRRNRGVADPVGLPGRAPLYYRHESPLAYSYRTIPVDPGALATASSPRGHRRIHSPCHAIRATRP